MNIIKILAITAAACGVMVSASCGSNAPETTPPTYVQPTSK